MNSLRSVPLFLSILGLQAAAQAAPAAGSTYSISSVASGLVVDVSGASLNNGTQVWLWQNLGYTNQQWTLQAASNGAFALINLNSGKALDVSGGNTANGASVIQWDFWNGNNQLWQVRDAGGGNYNLVNVNSGKCLDAFIGETSNGTGLQQWDCGSGSNQQWQFSGAGGSSGGSTPPPPSSGGSTSSTPGLHVQGNTLYDENGQAVRLHGVNISSLEWSNSEPGPYSTPAPCWAGQTIVDSAKEAVGNWHVNFVRLPVSPDRWWNAVDGQGNQYRATVDAVVDYVTSQGAYIDVDTHISDMGVWGQNLSQHFMPDDNTQTVIADIAAHFAGNQRVIIGIYNEPHDVDWNTWRNGGYVNENGTTYHTPGIQAMVDTVRAAGAKNVVSVSGLDWSFNLTGIMNGYAINDSNLMYESHIYTFKGMPDNWDANITVARDTYPVLIGEFGADWQNLSPYSNPQDFLNDIHSWLDQHNYNYSAWNLHPTSWPPLISDWCFTLTSPFGTSVVPWL